MYTNLCDIKSDIEVRKFKFLNMSKTIDSVVVRYMVLAFLLLFYPYFNIYKCLLRGKTVRPVENVQKFII